MLIALLVGIIGGAYLALCAFCFLAVIVAFAMLLRFALFGGTLL